MAESRIALVIGNSSYKNVSPLDNPKNDATLMAATLRELGFALVGGGTQLDLDKNSFDQAVQDFGRRLQGADVGLFYYAGHGVQVRGTNYLVPINANPTRESDVDFQLLDANLILRQMEAAGTRLNMIVLDACRNNPFGGRGLRSTSSGLAQMQAPQGTMISFATQPGNVAQDGDGGNSPYTAAFVRTIKKPGLGLFDAFNEIGLLVKQATGGTQQPWISSSPISGSFYFAGSAAGSGPAPAASSNAPQARDPAAEAWAEIKDTRNTAVLEDFVRHFGNSFYATLARTRLDELKKSKADVATPPTPLPSPRSSEATDAWKKFCSAAGSRQICVTGKSRRVQGKAGEFEWFVALIDRPDKTPLLRVGVPTPVQIKLGTRVRIDNLPRSDTAYFSCYASLCFSDYELDQKSASALKQGGNTLNIQSIKLDGQPRSIDISIADFGMAYRSSPLTADIGEEKGILAAITGDPVSEGASPTAIGRASLAYTPWIRHCGKGQGADAKRVCFTGKDARTTTGVAVAAAALIEPEGEPKTIVRITLPSPLRLEHGARLIIDQQQPLTGPFFTCFAAGGCMADYEGSPGLIGKLKKGRTLTLQAVNLDGDAVSFSLPLAEFAKANEGPPIDPQIYQEQQKKLREQLQERSAKGR